MTLQRPDDVTKALESAEYYNRTIFKDSTWITGILDYIDFLEGRIYG